MADCCDEIFDEDLSAEHAESASFSGSSGLEEASHSDKRFQPSTKAPRRGRGKRLGPGFTTLTSRFRVHNNSKKQPSQTLMKKLRDVGPNPFLIVQGNGGLDPFFPLPTTLSERDRGLLHFYLTDLPRIWYGMTSNPVFSIARDVAVPRGAESEPHLSWMLLAAENMRKSAPEEEKTGLIASRRASNYRKMRLLLEDPQTRNLDSTMATLALAGSAEMRLGSLNLARKHLRAVFHLLAQRDGLRTLQRMTGNTGLEIMHVLHQVGSPMILNSPTVIQMAFDRTRMRLKEMYAWNMSCRNKRSQDQTPQDQPPVMQFQLETDFDYTARPKGARYWNALRQTLGAPSIISECLRPALRDLPEAARRCRVGSLYCLNSVLFNLRNDEDTAQYFLMDLAHIVSNSYNLAATDRTREELSLQKLHIAMALPATIAHCAMRHGQWLDAQWRMTPPALRTWESLEFVELVMLMSPQRRHSMLSMMHSWLSDTNELSEGALPGGLELEEIKEEIMAKWMANNSIG